MMNAEDILIALAHRLEHSTWSQGGAVSPLLDRHCLATAWMEILFDGDALARFAYTPRPNIDSQEAQRATKAINWELGVCGDDETPRPLQLRELWIAWNDKPGRDKEEVIEMVRNAKRWL